MFFCDPCAERNEWPRSSFKSYGSCELCGTVCACSDVPSSVLPIPKERESRRDPERSVFMWTVYDHPLDDPDHVVVRKWLVSASGVSLTQESTAVETLEQARDWIGEVAPQAVQLPRAADDDPNIAEVWL